MPESALPISRLTDVSRFVLGLLVCSFSGLAGAYGVEGHLIAGGAAADLICERARSEIATLAGDEELGEVGVWADRIRSDDRYSDSGPWHYMNIATGVSLAEFQHPPEGDVLWAIEHFAERLRDERLGPSARGEALKFLVHFVVDLHQPLHVGLAEDRGGNTIDLEFRGEATNLHRFWDTHAIEAAGLSVTAYTESLRRDLLSESETVSLDPLVWAEESLRLRSRVYDFGQVGRQPRADYIQTAAAITRERLSLAARRLAGTLNAFWCD